MYVEVIHLLLCTSHCSTLSMDAQSSNTVADVTEAPRDYNDIYFTITCLLLITMVIVCLFWSSVCREIPVDIQEQLRDLESGTSASRRESHSKQVHSKHRYSSNMFMEQQLFSGMHHQYETLSL